MNWPSTRRKTARAVARDRLLTELRAPQQFVDGHLTGPPKQAVGATLTDVDLSGADLRRAQLQRIDLRRARLDHARFDDADLSNADLDGADLKQASFARCRLLDTTFHDADLTGCDFSQASGLSPSAVRKARSLVGVRWPDGFSPNERSVIGPLLH